MLFTRAYAVASKNTFSIPHINALLERYINRGMVVIDPFANNSKWGTITNDLNTEFETDYHLDALAFLKLMKSNSADVVLYDPPYSTRQVVECYTGVGLEVTKETTQASWRARHLDQIMRVLKIGGKCISFGWNSNGVGSKRGCRIIEILLIAHGGSKYDTIVTVDNKESFQKDWRE
jgi:hypothetical protein